MVIFEDSTISMLEAILQHFQETKDSTTKFGIRKEIGLLALRLGLLEEIYPEASKEYPNQKYYMLKQEV